MSSFGSWPKIPTARHRRSRSSWATSPGHLEDVKLIVGMEAVMKRRTIGLAEARANLSELTEHAHGFRRRRRPRARSAPSTAA